MKRLLLILAVVAFFATTVFLYHSKISRLEFQIKQLEAQVETQEKKITETRKANDIRVREVIRDVFIEKDNMSNADVDYAWDDFMQSVRERNQRRRNERNND